MLSVPFFILPPSLSLPSPCFAFRFNFARRRACVRCVAVWCGALPCTSAGYLKHADVAAPVAVAVANGGTATPGVTGGFSDSRSNSSVSSSTGAAVAALTKGKGFSRLKMYSPMKVGVRVCVLSSFSFGLLEQNRTRVDVRVSRNNEIGGS